jgi:hypothetical protein
VSRNDEFNKKLKDGHYIFFHMETGEGQKTENGHIISHHLGDALLVLHNLLTLDPARPWKLDGQAEKEI